MIIDYIILKNPIYKLKFFWSLVEVLKSSQVSGDNKCGNRQ